MSDQRFNTGNPIGSDSPLDRSDNTRDFDLAMNSTEMTFQDRMNVSRLTWAGIAAAGAGDTSIAVDAADRALQAASRAESAEAVVGAANIEDAVQRAESAAENAFVNADLYESIAEGILGTSPGQQFQVGTGGSYIRYRHEADGSSTPLGDYPNGAQVQEIQSSMGRFTGEDEIIPLFTDSQLKVLVGVNRETGEFFGKGILTESVMLEFLENYLGESSQAYYTGGEVYPIITDSAYRVLLGYDASSRKLVGAISVTGEAGFSSRNEVPLDYHISVSDTNHLFFYGQSNSTGADGAPPITTSQLNANMTFVQSPDGRNGAGVIDLNGVGPLIEKEVETPCSGAANYASVLMAGRGVPPSDHVIFVSTAGVGSRGISELSKGHPDGLYNNAISYIQAAYDQTDGCTVPAFAWIQGERDANTLATTYEDYLSAMIQLRNDLDADSSVVTGQSEAIPMLCVQINFNSLVRDDVARAQYDASTQSDRIFIVTPSYRLPYVNQVHFGRVGAKLAGCYIGRAYEQMLSGNQPDSLRPISAIVSGKVVSARFEVPCPPMTFDVDTLDAVTNYGFSLRDDSGAVGIESISINFDIVTITASRDMIGDVLLRYALDAGPGRGVTGEGGGNLRDSAPEIVTIEGEKFNMYNFSPAFQIQAIKSGV